MSPEQFRANAAGYLDSAETLIGTVVEVLKVGERQKINGKPKVEVPPAVYAELLEAQEQINRVSNWILSPINTKFEKGEK